MITLYGCGPTTYSKPHIGNLRTMVAYYNTYLEMSKTDQVKLVINITDIDDKIMDACGIGKDTTFIEDIHLPIIREYTEPFNRYFKECLVKLGIDLSNIHFVYATEWLPQMRIARDSMISNGSAYVREDGVFIDTSKIPGYETTGDDPDFAIWKYPQDRPGWHLECTVMSIGSLGKLDHHMGGSDLQFPHHYNENAQALALTGKPLCDSWGYCKHLLVDGRKMSKSLGNVYTMEDIEARGFTGADLRNLFDNHNQEKELNFTWDKLEQFRVKTGDTEKLLDNLSKHRANLRAGKEYDQSDQLRDLIKDSGFEVED